MKKIIKRWAVPVLTVIFVSIFPAVFLYGNNANEADFKEVLVPMLVLTAISLSFFSVAAAISRKPWKSSVVTVLFVVVFENFAGLETLLLRVAPNLRYWQTTVIFLFVLSHLAYFIYRFLPEDMEHATVSVLCLVFGALVVLNLGTAVPGEINKWNARQLEEEKKKQSEVASSVASEQTDLPNIYLLIFDEYAGFQQIKSYYGYDNVRLEDYLLDHRFTISYDSYNESTITTTITTNLVNLDYVVTDDTPESEKEVLRHNGYLFDFLSQMGYEIRKVSSTNFYGTEGAVQNITPQVFAQTVSGESLGTLLYKKTALYPFVGVKVIDALPEISYMESDENIPPVPTFTIMHVCSPHQPFYFDKNGNLNPARQWNNWDEPQYYLGQYQYTTEKMIGILDTLLGLDDDALIMVMSDHGARYAPYVDLEREARNVLNTFYYRGEDLSLFSGESGVNTIRMLLNYVLDTDFDKVEVR